MVLAKTSEGFLSKYFLWSWTLLLCKIQWTMNNNVFRIYSLGCFSRGKKKQGGLRNLIGQSKILPDAINQLPQVCRHDSNYLAEVVNVKESGLLVAIDFSTEFYWKKSIIWFSQRLYSFSPIWRISATANSTFLFMILPLYNLMLNRISGILSGFLCRIFRGQQLLI